MILAISLGLLYGVGLFGYLIYKNRTPEPPPEKTAETLKQQLMEYTEDVPIIPHDIELTIPLVLHYGERYVSYALGTKLGDEFLKRVESFCDTLTPASIKAVDPMVAFRFATFLHDHYGDEPSRPIQKTLAYISHILNRKA